MTTEANVAAERESNAGIGTADELAQLGNRLSGAGKEAIR